MQGGAPVLSGRDVDLCALPQEPEMGETALSAIDSGYDYFGLEFNDQIVNNRPHCACWVIRFNCLDEFHVLLAL
jgi:hypothetical protein